MPTYLEEYVTCALQSMPDISTKQRIIEGDIQIDFNTDFLAHRYGKLTVSYSSVIEITIQGKAGLKEISTRLARHPEIGTPLVAGKFLIYEAPTHEAEKYQLVVIDTDEKGITMRYPGHNKNNYVEGKQDTHRIVVIDETLWLSGMIQQYIEKHESTSRSFGKSLATPRLATAKP
ncbi:hypothetical protein HZB02_00500 [Candidatus Woesearchaeota archaeon]|nr:hypothetical protein [Candidatus Woesearchaeota archaeon]